MRTIGCETSKMKPVSRQPLSVVTGILLLTFAIISTILLSSCSQAAEPSQASAPPVKIPSMLSLPAPAAAAIPSLVSQGHDVAMTIAGGVVYLGTTDNMAYALRSSDGKLLWRQAIAGGVDIQPVVSNGVVYLNSFEGSNGPDHVYALRASDGSVLWRYNPNGYTYISPTIGAGGVLYLASQDGVYALQGSNGHVLWRYATSGSGDDNPVVVNGVVYAITTENGQSAALYALRADDGGLLWRYQEGNTMTTPIVQNGVVYVFADDGKLAALQASDGHTLWQSPIDINMVQSMQLVNGVIYISASKMTVATATSQIASPQQDLASIGGLFWNAGRTGHTQRAIPLKEARSSVYAVRARDGAVLWHYSLGNGADSWAGWLAVDNSMVYASSFAETSGMLSDEHGDIYGLQRSNGAVIWHDSIKADSLNALLANGVIYLVGSYNNQTSSVVYALHASDGAYLWNYAMNGDAYDAPLQNGSNLYVAPLNGILYVLRSDRGVMVWHYQTNVGM